MQTIFILENTRTQSTTELSFCRMIPDVSSEGRTLRESQHANVALEWSLSRVHQQVVLVGGAVPESLAALLAIEGPLTGVYAAMSCQGTGTSE